MASNHESEFAAYVVELLDSVGPVTARRMFGGHGVFLGGLMIGLIADDVLYLKTNEQTRAAFEERGLEAFVYLKKGKEVRMSFHRVPDEAMEDSAQMATWATMAINAAAAARQ